MAKASHQNVRAVQAPVSAKKPSLKNIIYGLFSVGLAACLALIFIGQGAAQSTPKAQATFDDALKFWGVPVTFDRVPSKEMAQEYQQRRCEVFLNRMRYGADPEKFAPIYGLSLLQLGRLEVDFGNPAQGRRDLDTALTVSSGDVRMITDLEFALAQAAVKTGSFEDAASMLIRIEEQTDCAGSDLSQRWVWACSLLGDLYRIQAASEGEELTPHGADTSCHFTRARESYLKMIARCRSEAVCNRENIARGEYELALLYEQYGLTTNSESAYQLALSSAQEMAKQSPELTRSISSAYYDLLSRTDPVAAFILHVQQSSI